MRENRQSGSEGGAGLNPSFRPLFCRNVTTKIAELRRSGMIFEPSQEKYCDHRLCRSAGAWKIVVWQPAINMSRLWR